jgi:uncharacterized membrane protein YeiB
LPFSKEQQHIILLIGLVEMMTAIHNVQFNPMLTGWIILSFVLVEKKQDFWACLFIVAGLYIKIYGIVGIAFFWFSKNKIRFILSFLFWLVILFCLPMVISSPAFIVQSYKDWINAIVEKNAQNIDAKDENMMQDISMLGMIRRVFQVEHLKNYFITVPAAICYALPFLRFSQFKHVHFRITYLCIAMIGVVIFSSSAESSTYVIAVTGVAIWFIIQEKQKWVNYLLGFVILLTSLSATDLFPPYVREHWILPFSLKALPCSIAWIVMVYQLLSKDFQPTPATPKTAI